MKKPLLRPLLLSFTLALAGGAAAWALGPRGAEDTLASFVIADDDGYGVGTCLSGKPGCGQDVADAWCLANGYVHAVAIRKAEAADLTQSIAERSSAGQPDSTLITCEK